MSVTISTTGDNSVRVSYTAGSLLSELMSQVQTYLVLRGWAVWDAAAGANAICFRALQPGGTAGTAAHYHYLVLDFSGGFIVARVWELWDSATHTGTNKAINTYYLGSVVAETALGQRYDLTNGGILDIHASSRFVLLWSEIPAGIGSASGNAPTIIGTRERTEALDTLASGYPSSLWANGLNLLRATGHTYRWSLPRGPVSGSSPTAADAGQFGAIYLPGIGWYGQFTASAAAPVWVGTNPMSGKINVSDLVLAGNAYIFGRLYDYLVAPSASAAPGDTVVVPVDSDGFLQRGGSSKSYRAFASLLAAGQVLLVPW